MAGEDTHNFPDWVLKIASPINYRILAATKDSYMFSIMPFHIQQVTKAYTDTIPSNEARSIIDMTAHVGVDAFVLWRSFPSTNCVKAFEIDEPTFNLLKLNFSKAPDVVRGASSRVFQAILGDSMDYFKSIRMVDLVFCDPPWGGKDYIEKDKIMLELSGVPIGEIVRRVMTNRVKWFVLKLPKNSDFERIEADATSTAKCNLVQKIDINTPTGKVSYVLWFFRKA